MSGIFVPRPEGYTSTLDLTAQLHEATRRDIQTSTPFDPQNDHFWDAAGAAFQRENILASAWHELTDGDSSNEPLVAGYNPYSRLKAMYDKETLDQLAPNISRDDFGLVRTDRQLKAVVDDIMYERDLKARMDRNGFGAFLGGAGGVVLDPTSYIPFIGSLEKVGALGKIGLTAFNAALSATASEAVLQATQRDRSADETLMNIAFSGVIGGGLGMFAAGLHPKSPLNPKHPGFVLGDKAIAEDGVILRDLAGNEDVISPAEMKWHRAAMASDLGAAAADTGSVPVIARPEPKGPIGTAVRGASDWFFGNTILGSGLRSTSNTMRWAVSRIADPAGVILEQNLAGKATAPSAEIIKQTLNSEFEDIVQSFRGKTAVIAGDMAKRPDFKDVMLLTQRQLFAQIEPELMQKMVDKYGQTDAQKLIDLSKGFAETGHQFNKVWEERLMKAGLLGNPKVIASHEANLKAAREAVREAVKRQAPAAEIAGLRISRDRIASLLNDEKQKGVPLGRDYGHAQVWNREMLFQNPEGFKAYLHKVLIDHPNEDWLIENHHMTLDEFNSLPEAEKTAIKEDWAGDAQRHTLDGLERQIAALEGQLKTQELDLREGLKWFGAIEDRQERLTLSEARKKRDRIWSQLIVAQELKRQLPDIKTHVDKGADPSLQALAQDLRVGHPIRQSGDKLGGSQIGDTEDVALAEQSTGQITVGPNFHRYPEKLQREILAHEQGHIRFPFVEAFLSLGNKRNLLGEMRRASQHLSPRLWELKDPVLVEYRNSGVELIAEAHALYQTDRAMAEKLMPEATKLFDQELGYMKMGAEELDNAKAKAQKLEAQWVKTNETLTDLKRSKAELRKGLTDRKMDIRQTEKDIDKAQRSLTAEANKTPLNELIDDVYRALSEYNDVPHAILQRILDASDRTTGRVKQRVLNLTREQRLEALQNGWLRDDLLSVLRSQTDQLSSELALREALDMGPGKKFEKWADVLNALDREYQDAIAAAPTQEQKTALSARHNVDRQNLIHVRDRLRGSTHVDDGTNSGVLRWTIGAVQKANLLRYGSGFLLGSMTDLGTMALQNGGLIPLMLRYGKQTIGIMTKAAEEDPTHFQSLISSVEVGMGAHASAPRFGTEDPLHGTMYGYGMGSGLTRKLTAKFDQTMEVANDIGMKIGGLPMWNKFAKTVAGLHLINRMKNELGKWDQLSDAARANWANIGIGRTEAENVAAFMSKYAETLPNKTVDPHFEKWAGVMGEKAKRDAQFAFMRHMNLSILTPGIGDTPRITDTLLGRFLFTFQRYAFAALNKHIYPMAQRIGVLKEKQAAMSLGILLMSAMTVLIGKDILNGRDPMDRLEPENLSTTLYDVIDRSGFLGYLSPYADAAIKTVGMVVPNVHGNTRYAANGPLESLLGVNMALGRDVLTALGSAFQDDPNKGAKIARILPLSAQVRVLMRLEGALTNN